MDFSSKTDEDFSHFIAVCLLACCLPTKYDFPAMSLNHEIFLGNFGLVAADEDAVAKPKVPEGVIMDGFTADDEKNLEAAKESFSFQAEVSRLMDIIINSLCKQMNPSVFC